MQHSYSSNIISRDLKAAAVVLLVPNISVRVSLLLLRLLQRLSRRSLALLQGGVPLVISIAL
jgi:hypothetical protein